MNPINSCLYDNTYSDFSDETKKDIKKCITDYTKILLDDTKFIEQYEMLVRV